MKVRAELHRIKVFHEIFSTFITLPWFTVVISYTSPARHMNALQREVKIELRALKCVK